MSDSWKIEDGKIPDGLRTLLEQEAARESDFRKEQIPNPPWKKYPELERYSLGWRMGSGEDYMTGFREWFVSLDDNQRSSYRYLHSEPDDWLGFYDSLSKSNQTD